MVLHQVNLCVVVERIGQSIWLGGRSLYHFLRFSLWSLGEDPELLAVDDLPETLAFMQIADKFLIRRDFYTSEFDPEALNPERKC